MRYHLPVSKFVLVDKVVRLVPLWGKGHQVCSHHDPVTVDQDDAFALVAILAGGLAARFAVERSCMEESTGRKQKDYSKMSIGFCLISCLPQDLRWLTVFCGLDRPKKERSVWTCLLWCERSVTTMADTRVAINNVIQPVKEKWPQQITQENTTMIRLGLALTAVIAKGFSRYYCPVKFVENFTLNRTLVKINRINPWRKSDDRTSIASSWQRWWGRRSACMGWWFSTCYAIVV